MLIARGFRLSLAKTFPLYFHRRMNELLGIEVVCEGQMSTDCPTLFVCNHTSYIDIFVLGSVLPGPFAAKLEVASWPVFGQLAKLQNTLFLERRARRAVEQIEAVRHHLHTRGNLILFPEGTSTDGTHVLPFRSSLFAAADDITVQPVSVAYVAYEGQKMSARERDCYAWYLPDPEVQVPNRPFAEHLYEAMGLGRSTVRVMFHEPVTMLPGQRKECALACETAVREGLNKLLAAELEGMDDAKLAARA